MTENAYTPRLRGKVVLVTGAGTGIGRAAALRFAREGAAVALAGRRPAELEMVAEEIGADGGTALAIPTDVSDEAAIDRLVAQTIEHLGGLNAAFNNAGALGAIKPIVELSAAEFDAVMGVNLRGVWLLLRAEVRAMLSAGRGGAIVNTGSFVAQASTPGTSAYAASKAALEAMVRAVALEVGPQGVRINNVAPGVIRTPMSAGLEGPVAAPFAAQAALRRLGEPEDVADAAVWLCTDEARFVTGQTLLVDGGFAIPGLR